MGRMTRVAILALALAAILGGILGGTNEAAAGNGYEQWVAYPDGCYYFWDGYAHTLGACPRADGGFNFYVPSSSQWVYSFSTGYLSDGGIWTYYQGVYYYDVVDTGYVNGIYPTTYTSGGTNYGLTDNVVANQFMIDAVLGSNDKTLAQYCYDIDGNICYR